MDPILTSRKGSRSFSVIVLTAACVVGSQASAHVFPAENWAYRVPQQVGLSLDKLHELRNALESEGVTRGAIVRAGYMVYFWGSQDQVMDLASATKVLNAHFLFEAQEAGLLSSIDHRVNHFEPCINGINADLDYKDREITFRHLATQTSCYGMSEEPGTAFNYNDYNMALFYDTLMLRVFDTTHSNVDSDVLWPRLCSVIDCQDAATFNFPGRPEGRAGFSVRDFARFGWLYLNQGNWNGVQVISGQHALMAVNDPLDSTFPNTDAKAVEMCDDQRSIGSTEIPQHQTDHVGSYSFAWWVNGQDENGVRHWPNAPLDTFGAFGHDGTRAVVVMPSLRLVASWNMDTSDPDGSIDLNHVLGLLRDSVEGPTAVVEDAAPPAPGLLIAYPNPASQQVTIEWDNPITGLVHLGVYDATGRQIRSFSDGIAEAGHQRMVWNVLDPTGGASNGVYFIRLLPAGEAARSIKLIVSR
jgi:CubicO group peptidase (beta-lactamase class C family)